MQALLVAIALFGAAAVVSAPTDIARGLAWLQAQVMLDGQLAGNSFAADPMQAQCETATTLRKLTGGNAQIGALVANLQSNATGDNATETLACVQLLRQQLGQTILNPEVEQRRVGGQGYAAYEGFGVANALDTGWALAAQLQNLGAADKARALAWLQTAQAADGSYAANGQPDLLSTAVLLRGLKTEASTDPVAASIAAKAATYLLGIRSAQGPWANDVALTALVFEAVHPYSAQNPAIASGVDAYLLAQQQPDGSWQGDSYVTAVALRALALAAQPPLNPTTAGLKIKFVDARNAAALPGVMLTSTGPGAIAANSDAAGQIELRGLAPGAYPLRATLAGYASVNLSATLVAGQLLDLGLVQMIVPTNPSAAVVSGTVRDQDSGAGLAGVTVSVQGQTASATSHTDGSYLISNVTPGALTLSATKSGYLSASGGASVQAGQVLDFSPRLAVAGAGGGSLCTLQGTVRDASSNAALVGVSIQVTGANTAGATTDTAGRYSINGLASSNVTVVATKAGYDVAQASTRMVCDALRPSSVDFSPRLYAANQSPSDANTAGMTGVVVDAGTNHPIAGAQITVTPSVGGARFTLSQSNGGFSVQGLNGASAQLQVQATGDQGMTLQFALAPLENFDAGQLRLRPPKVEQLLPDLTVLAVKRHTTLTDPQTLQLTGAIEAQVANVGNLSAPTNVVATAFSDVNRNGQFDAGTDLVLGQASIAQSLAPHQSVTLAISVAGTLPFRDAPIHVLVDASAQVTEADKANNVGSTTQSIIRIPIRAEFQPKLKYKWSTGQVMMTPVVGKIHDTNGDGKIDEKDTPRIVFTSYVGSYFSPSSLVAIDGATGQEVLNVPPSVFGGLHSQVGLALADLDGDGIPEIIGNRIIGGVVVLRPDGTVKWQAAGPGTGWVSIADIDADGAPEVFAGSYVYSNSGALKFDLSTHGGCAVTDTSYAAKLYLDRPGLQIVCGSSVYGSDGVRLWSGPVKTWRAMPTADFNQDGAPEFVLVANGGVRLLNAQGQTLWGPVSLGGGDGGAPMIADFDGDGVPDIGVAGASRYTVVRADGSILWQAPISDGSANTGSTAFDFDGDGKVEVIFRDQGRLWVFDGSTGTVLFQRQSSSATGNEYPLVADVDQDGRSDLVVPGDSGMENGIHVYQDVNNAWVASRSVWNQYDYSITNINDDLSVPRSPVPSWQTHNTFRLNKRIDGDPRAIADLTLSYVRVADAGALGATLTVRAGNGGSYKIPVGTKLAVYNADASTAWPGAAARLATAAITAELQPGQYEDIAIPLTGALSTIAPRGQLWLVGDDDGTGVHTVPDFDRGNNTIAADVSAIATNLSLIVATDKAAYNELDQAVFTATVGNGGSFARSPQVRLSVLDAAGVLVQVLPLPAPASVAPGNQASIPGQWPVAGVLSGHYQVLAELVTPQGLVYGSAKANFAVQASQNVTATARTRADRASYDTTQTVQLTSSVSNLTRNTPLEDLRVKTTVLDAGGQVLWSRTEPILQLVGAAQRQFSYSLSASTLEPASYTARVQLLDAQGGVLAQDSTTFKVLQADTARFGMRGQLQATPAAVKLGQSVTLSLQLQSQGTANIPNATARVRVIEAASGRVLATLSSSVSNWTSGSTRTVHWNWPSSGTPGQELVAAATVEVNGQEIAVAQAPMQLMAAPVAPVAPVAPPVGAATVQSVPTLSELGQAVLVLLMAALAVWRLRRHEADQGS